MCRYVHTQSGLRACGGHGGPGNRATHSCSTFTQGSWVTINTKEQSIIMSKTEI